jgi:hypothetical protein
MDDGSWKGPERCQGNDGQEIILKTLFSIPLTIIPLALDFSRMTKL